MAIRAVGVASGTTGTPGNYVAGLTLGAGISGAARSANATTVAAAVTAAIGSAVPVVILPAGIIEWDITTAVINITGSVKIKGQGIATTSIRVFPSTGTPSWSANFFNITAANATVELEDFELLGPQVPTSSSAGRGVYMSTATAGLQTYIRRVHIGAQGGANATGFTIGVNEDNQANRLTQLEDCEIGPCSEQGWSYNADNGATGYTGNVARAIRTYFHDVGTTSLMHCCYHHPNVASDFYGCRWGNTTGYALQLNGTPTVAAPYHRFVDCINDGNNSGFLVGTNGDLAQFDGGYFSNGTTRTAFNLNGPIRVTGGKVTNTQLVHRVNNTGYEVEFNGTHLDVGANNLGNTLDGTCNYIFNNCVFKGNIAGLVFLANQTDASHLYVDNCVFSPTLCASGIRADTGTTIVTDTKFIGAFNTASLEYHGNAQTVNVIMDGCDTSLLTAGESIAMIGGASGYGRVRVTNHQHNVDGLHGIWSNTAGEYQLGTPKMAMCPTTITAAATISLDPNYNAFHITGATVISTILWANSAVYTRTMSGQAYFIFDTGALNQITGGATANNTTPGLVLSPTLTTVAKTMYTGVYDAQAFGWYIK